MATAQSVVGYLPACRLEKLGDAAFRAEHGLKYAYVSGAMANGIGSTEIVEAMAEAGMLGVFGAAGFASEPKVERAIDRLQGIAWQSTSSLRVQPDPQPERPVARGRRGRALSSGEGSG